MLDALLEGRGLGMVMEDRVRPYLADGRVAQVLDDWCQPFWASTSVAADRRQSSAVSALVTSICGTGSPSRGVLRTGVRAAGAQRSSPAASPSSVCSP